MSRDDPFRQRLGQMLDWVPLRQRPEGRRQPHRAFSRGRYGMAARAKPFREPLPLHDGRKLSDNRRAAQYRNTQERSRKGLPHGR